MAHLAAGLLELESTLRSVATYADLPQLQTARFKLTRTHENTHPEPMFTAMPTSEMLEQAAKALADTVSLTLITIMRDLKTHFANSSWLAEQENGNSGLTLWLGYFYRTDDPPLKFILAPQLYCAAQSACQVAEAVPAYPCVSWQSTM